MRETRLKNGNLLRWDYNRTKNFTLFIKGEGGRDREATIFDVRVEKCGLEKIKCEARGAIQVKGKEEMEVWRVLDEPVTPGRAS